MTDPIRDNRLVYFPIFHDENQPGYERSEDGRRWFERLLIPSGQGTYDEDQANAYLVFTGDGGMLHAVTERYQHGKVFVGCNRGREGFLMNNFQELGKIPLTFDDLILIQVRLIEGTFKRRGVAGRPPKHVAFNDIFVKVERNGYGKFTINGQFSEFPVRTVWGDGIIIATPQGTTAYTLGVGGNYLPLDSDSWSISGIATGKYPHDIVRPQRIVIDIECRTPIHAYADNVEFEDVEQVIIEPTNEIVTLGFDSSADFEAKRRSRAQKFERGE